MVSECKWPGENVPFPGGLISRFEELHMFAHLCFFANLHFCMLGIGTRLFSPSEVLQHKVKVHLCLTHTRCIDIHRGHTPL